MQINVDRLKTFEETINTIHPEKGVIPINVLGYGEISLVFEFVEEDEGVAYKRLPIFENETQIQRHIQAYQQYHTLLNDLNITIPEEDAVWLKANDGTYVLYCAQAKIDPETIGNRILHHQISDEEIYTLVRIIMRKLSKIWLYNKRSSDTQIDIRGRCR